jgi:hypothetical protein
MKPKTKKQYLDDLGKLTRRELYALINGLGNTTYGGIEENISGPNGPIRQVECIYDAENDTLLYSKEIEWTYYLTGQVDTIVIIKRNADGSISSRQEIKHFIDGKQPQIQE